MHIKKIVNYHTADSKSVKQEVNGTVILPPLVFPAQAFKMELQGMGMGLSIIDI